MITQTTLHPNIKHESFVVNPDVIRVTKFEEPDYEKFCNDFKKAVQAHLEIIPIHIDSYGGQVYSLFGMIDLVKSARVPVMTFIGSKAMSAGAALFSCGTEGYRIISPYAHVMVHQVSSGAVGKVEDIKVRSDQTQKLNKQLMSLMAKNCGHHSSYFYDLLEANQYADIYLDPRDAVKHNLANQIGTPRVKFELKQEMSVEIIKSGRAR